MSISTRGRGATISPFGRLLLVIVIVGIVVASAMLGSPQTAHALEWVEGGHIPAGMTVDDDVLLVAEPVLVEGTVNGDLVAVGNHVTINGKVNGSVLLIGGDTVTINGSVQGSAYALGANVYLGPQVVVGRSAHLLAVHARTQAGCAIGRDMLIGAYSAVVGGRIERDLKTLVLVLNLQGQMRDRASNLGADLLIAAVRSPILATIGHVALGSDWTIEQGSRMLPRAESTKGTPDSVPQGATRFLDSWLRGFVYNVVILLLVGAILLLVIRQLLSNWAARILADPLPTAGYGVLISVVFPFAAVVAAVLVAVVGIALLLVGLSGAVLPLYGFAFFGIGFAASVFALFFWTVSQVIVGVLVGSLILRRLLPGCGRDGALALVIGVIVLSIFGAVPTAGMAINVLAGFVALGAAWLAWRDS
jgi:hypothetical protein